MKRLIITLSVVLALAFNSFASDVKVSRFIMQDFKTRFIDAENTSWSQSNGFTIAEFTMDGEKQFAYYSQAGELVLVANPIELPQLAKSLRNSLKNDFAAYTVTNIFRIDDNESVKYFAVLENSDSKIIVKSSATKWNQVKTTSK